MKQGATIFWLVLCGACLFYMGYLTHSFMNTKQEKTAPTYLELLTSALNLTDNQQIEISKILADEDRGIQGEMNSKEGQIIFKRIQAIREDLSKKIIKTLDKNQKIKYQEMLSDKKDSRELFK